VAWWVGYRFVWLGRDVHPAGRPGEAGEVAVTVRPTETGGGSETSGERAGVWSPKTGLTDYETLDDLGWLAGTAVLDGAEAAEERHGFLAQPVR
jgi:hypothetical protein